MIMRKTTSSDALHCCREAKLQLCLVIVRGPGCLISAQHALMHTHQTKAVASALKLNSHTTEALTSCIPWVLHQQIDKLQCTLHGAIDRQRICCCNHFLILCGKI